MFVRLSCCCKPCSRLNVMLVLTSGFLSSQLAYCIVQFLEKDPTLTEPVSIYAQLLLSVTFVCVPPPRALSNCSHQQISGSHDSWQMLQKKLLNGCRVKIYWSNHRDCMQTLLITLCVITASVLFHFSFPLPVCHESVSHQWQSQKCKEWH